MRKLLLTLVLLGGCTSTPQVEVNELTPAPTSEIIQELTQEELLNAIQQMVAERNRLQRRLYSISTYHLDIPAELRDAIHCGDLSQDVIRIPNSDYLKLAGKIVNSPEQMEELLVGYIKTLILTINESNAVIITQEARRLECYNKFKP